MVHKIEIKFPIGVEFPDGFERDLSNLVEKVCKKYIEENPSRIMWPSSHGHGIIWDEPNEPTFNDDVYEIGVCERKAFAVELLERDHKCVKQR